MTKGKLRKSSVEPVVGEKPAKKKAKKENNLLKEANQPNGLNSFKKAKSSQLLHWRKKKLS